jgi:hypothetical protein
VQAITQSLFGLVAVRYLGGGVEDGWRRAAGQEADCGKHRSHQHQLVVHGHHFKVNRAVAGLPLTLSVLQDQVLQEEITSLDVAALALIGALQRQVGMTTRCSACFRWSEPGTYTCAEHRSADPFDSHCHSPRARRIERSRQLADAIFGERFRHGEVVFERCVGSLNWLRRTLWQVADEEEREAVDELMMLVTSLPNLLEAMHTTTGRLRRDSLLVRLRRHIDPLEIRPAAWVHLVQLADVWLGAEALGFETRRGGTTLRTLAKVRKAMEVAASTGAGRNAVAKAVGVHPTLISHWARRFQIDVIPLPSTPGKRRK